MMPNFIVEYDDRIEIKIVRLNGDVKWCIIDKEDYIKVKDYKWRFMVNYACSDTKKVHIKMHNLIINFKSNKEFSVDHINRNGLDNRKCNLRICSRSENEQNKSCKNLFKGVCLRSDGLYISQITKNKRAYKIGAYDNIIDAAIAYDIAALILYGNNAYVNFPFLKGYNDDEIPEKILLTVKRNIESTFKQRCRSKYFGVTYKDHVKKKPWAANINLDKKHYHLGYFETEVEAAKAYNKFIIDNKIERKLNIIE